MLKRIVLFILLSGGIGISLSAQTVTFSAVYRVIMEITDSSGEVLIRYYAGGRVVRPGKHERPGTGS
jgi:hypothetical protein